MATRNPLAEILDKTLEPEREGELLERDSGELRPTFAGRVKAPRVTA